MEIAAFLLDKIVFFVKKHRIIWQIKKKVGPLHAFSGDLASDL